MAERQWNVPMQALEIPAQPDEAVETPAMTFITIICFLVITVTTSIMVAMLSVELFIKGGLAAVDPVNLICFEQIIFAGVVVAGLLILGGE